MSNSDTQISSLGVRRFHALFVTDRLYYKGQNTTSFSCSKSCLYPLFGTVKMQILRNSTNFITCRKSRFLTNDYAGCF